MVCYEYNTNTILAESIIRSQKVVFMHYGEGSCDQIEKNIDN